MAGISNEVNLIYSTSRLSSSASGQERIKALLAHPLDWDYLITLADRHKVTPLLYFNLKDLDAEKRIPPWTMTKIEQRFFSNCARNIVVEQEIASILQETGRSGIEVIALKGFALMEEIYRNPGLRIMCDVDILVKKEQLFATADILLAHGFQCDQGPLSGLSLAQYENELSFSKAIPGKEVLNIDLHWMLIPERPYALWLPYLWDRSTTFKLQGQEVRCLSKEDTLLSLALHLRRHLRNLTLGAIVDIAELLNQQANPLDWGYLKSSAKRNHSAASVYLALYLAKSLLGATVLDNALNEFRPDPLKRTLLARLINKNNFFVLTRKKATFLRLLLFENLFDFLVYLWRVSLFKRSFLDPIRKIPTVLGKEKDGQI